MPLDLVIGVHAEDEEEPKSADAYVQMMKENAETSYEIAREELRIAAERRKRSYDILVKKVDF